MTLDDVLARVNHARDEVANAFALLHARDNDADALLTDSKTRFDAVHAAFTELNAHIASESGRIATLTAKLTGEISGCATMLLKMATDQAIGFTGLQSRFTEIEQRHTDGDAAIALHETALGTHQDDIVGLLDAGKDEMASTRLQFHDTVDQLRATLKTLMDQTDAAVTADADALTKDMSDVCETEVGHLADQLMQMMDQTRAAITSLQEFTASDLQNKVSHVQTEIGALEGRVEDIVHKLSDAIDKLEEVATKVAGTLAEGGHEAAKLLTVTNVGIDQVFKFIEHVRKICEEITSAW